MQTPVKKLYTLSVHQFVDKITRSGDLGYGGVSVTRMQKGSEAHRDMQSASANQSEVPLSYSQQSNSITLEIRGRADMINVSEETITIEEIKTLFNNKNKQVADNSHVLQMKTYCAMYLLDNNIDAINGSVIYVQYDTGNTQHFEYSYTKDEILDWFYTYVNWIVDIFEKKQHNINVRDLSIDKMVFPYSDYRIGQKEMATMVYRSCKASSILFLEAPTGIGKTLATLYPSIKAMALEEIEKIFYLTAKTTIKNIAKSAITALRDNGLRIKSITLTAKEKSCPQKVFNCHPSVCFRARGYYDRVTKALDSLDYNVHHEYEDILKVANKFNICPFELSLDISLDADIIICDYNNVYDPRAKLKRFFDEGGNYTVLVDEAHNLVSRAREMYSSDIDSQMFSSLLSAITNTNNETTKQIYLHTMDVLGHFDQQAQQLKEMDVTYTLVEEHSAGFIGALEELVNSCESIVNSPEHKPYSKAVIDTYYRVRGYLIALAKIDKSNISYVMIEGKVVKYRIFCIDPASRLQECHKLSNNTVFFSASLTPQQYYTRLLQTSDDIVAEKLPSPFDSDNLLIMINATNNTEFRNRDRSMKDIVELIHTYITAKRGKYMIFFPSYSYMEKAHGMFTAMYDDVFAPKQQRGMSYEEQNAFIQLFDEEDAHMAAFVVMGGMFSEGIDLVGDRLIGAVIVGTGFPMISLESNMIKRYHDTYDESGMAYAYIYPGFNKVLQSVGRVVRTETDRGAILLIDRRFNHPHYIDMMPDNWQPINFTDDNEDVSSQLEGFWGE